MRLLTLTNLYPSAAQPRHGIFVEERLRQFVARGVAARVLALRPSAAGFVRAGAAAASGERRHGIDVEYISVPTLPMLTNWIDPWLWAEAAQRVVKQRLGERTDDVVLDAHFLYPDGVAATIIGERLGVPTVLTARGSDVNVKCENPVMRAWVRWAASRCAALITVSRALAVKLADFGIVAPNTTVLPNGVDLVKFNPDVRPAARERLAVQGRVVASVGHLVADKGHQFAVEAVAGIDDAVLLVVGDGPERGSLERLARRLGVHSRVRFLGTVPHERMPEIYAAADVLALASAREGMPNVVLESLACGTPVVATDVGGIAEVVTAAAAGVLMTERSAAALRDGLERLFANAPSRADTRSFATRFGWGAVVDRQLALYENVLAAARRTIAAGASLR